MSEVEPTCNTLQPKASNAMDGYSGWFRNQMPSFGPFDVGGQFQPGGSVMNQPAAMSIVNPELDEGEIWEEGQTADLNEQLRNSSQNESTPVENGVKYSPTRPLMASQTVPVSRQGTPHRPPLMHSCFHTPDVKGSALATTSDPAKYLCS